MKKIKLKYFLYIKPASIAFIFLLLLLGGEGVTQNVKVVPYNGSSSQQHSPQGSYRYLRQFYLIPPGELQSTDLQSGDEINSIGFTIGLPQDALTSGKFKVFLQNTTDEVSRYDTAWTYDTIATNSYQNLGLFAGNYEWQVSTNCGSPTEFSALATFSNASLPDCYKPDSLYASNITDSSATLSWNTLASIGFSHFLVEFRSSDASSWSSDTTSDHTYLLTGLEADKQYLWRVRSVCTSENSPSSGATFQTGYVAECIAPSDHGVTNIADSTVSLSWTPVDSAIYYEIRYRRSGSDFWYGTASFADTYDFPKVLLQGTYYDWEVRAICNAGMSDYTSGPGFMTTGTPGCYQPIGLMTSGLNETSATFTWVDIPGTVEYIIRFRLKETIAWEHAISVMDTVHNDSIIVPNTNGPYFISFVNGSTFTYNGNGLYVAFEYANGLDDLSSPNSALCNKQIGAPLSFVTRLNITDTAPPAILNVTQFRPETWFGSSAFKDSVEVEAVYAMGYNAIPFGNPTLIMARINNLSSQATTYPVTLTIKEKSSGSVRYTEDKDFDLSENSSGLVTFEDWSPVELGADSIIVSIPAQTGENVIENNTGSYVQVVNRNILSYADGTEALELASFGLGIGEGLLLNRHTMNGCGRIIGVHTYLDYSAIGQTVYGVVLDDSGNIITESLSFVPDSSNVNQYHAFYFADAANFTDEDFYVGLAQTAGSGAYYPLGVQWEGEHVRENAYYKSALDGTGLTEALAHGRLMIKAEIVPAEPVPFIYGDAILCSGDSGPLQVGSHHLRYANEIIDFSSEYSENAYGSSAILGVENVYPEHMLSSEGWISETTDDGREYLVIGFPDPAPINLIQIYESYNPGAIDTVYVKNPDSAKFEVVYEDTAQAAGEGARILKIEFGMTDFDVSEIRIAMNDTAVPGFNAIDAVAIGKVFRPASYDSYLWTPGDSTQASIIVTDAGTYEVEVTSGGCTASASFEVTTPSVIVPTISATGPTTFCDGGSVILKSSFVGGNTWSTGEIADSITVDESGSYTVSHDDGCVTSTSDPYVVTVNPLPVITFEGAVICQGESTELDAGAGYSQYVWSTGDSTRKITVDVTGFFLVTVTDGNGCVGIGSVVTIVQIPPSPHISGDFAFCPGDSTELDAGAGYSAYLWSTGETTRLITVNTSGDYEVIVTDANGCTGEDMVTVSQYAPPEPFISGSLGICVGSSTQLDAGGGYAAYLWSTGETSQTIFIDTSGLFSLTVTDHNGCTGSTSVSTSTEGVIPEAPGPITGPTDGLCNATGLVYSINPVLHAVFYVWTLPEGMTLVAGENTTTITVDVDNTLTVGEIVVAASNACGQSPSIDPTFLYVQGMPVQPGPISGPTTGICNTSGATYMIDPMPGVSVYTWNVPPGYSILSGQGTNSISIVYGGTSGEICVTSDNDCGESIASCMTVSVPEFTVDAGDCEFVFAGFSPLDCIDLTATVSGGVPPYTYAWVDLYGIVLGTTETITVCPEMDMSYVVFVTDANGCSTLDKVEVETIPAACKGGKVLVCHGGKTLCLSPGAAQNHLDHGDNLGSCDAEPCGGNGLPKGAHLDIGNLFEVESDAFELSHNQQELSIYPNPAGNTAYLDLNQFEGAAIVIDIYHALSGQVEQLRIKDVIESTYELDLRDLSAGIYIVSVRNSEGMRVSGTLIKTYQ